MGSIDGRWRADGRGTGRRRKSASMMIVHGHRRPSGHFNGVVIAVVDFVSSTVLAGASRIWARKLLRAHNNRK